MKAVEYTIGSAGNMQIVEVSRPQAPGPEQIEIKVMAAGVNRCDIMQRSGEYKVPPGNDPRLGIEVAGIVTQVGKNVKNIQINDHVFGYVNGGGYAEYCLMDQGFAISIPENWTYEEAAGIAEVFQTANEVLFTYGNLKQGETVLLHSGASGVGTAAIQMAKWIKANVVVTVGSDEKVAFCKKLGADLAINYKKNHFDKEVKKHYPEGVDLLIDSVGGSFFEDNLKSLKIDGRMMLIGLLGGDYAHVNLPYLIAKRLMLKGHNTRGRNIEEQREITKRFKEKWWNLLKEKQLKAIIDKVFPLEEVALAHHYMEENQNIGKIILKIGRSP